MPRNEWSFKPFVLGHRGARVSEPENTISAFQKAMQEGADGVELDVFLSKDGMPVVIHDDTVDRTTDGKGSVKDLTVQELGLLGVPSLTRALSAMPAGAIVNVELKEGGYFSKEILVDKAVQALEAEKSRLHFIVSSFDSELLVILRKKYPAYLVGWLLAPNEDNWPASLDKMDLIKPDAIHILSTWANPLLIALAKKAKIKVVLWTVNDPVEVQNWLEQGVDGVITDDPAACCDKASRVLRKA